MTDDVSLTRVLSDFAHRLGDDCETTDGLRDLVEGVTGVIAIAGAAVSVLNSETVGFAAASDETTAHLESVQAHGQSGPGIDAFRSTLPVLVADLADSRVRWPAFCKAASQAGVVAAAGIPMRFGDMGLGVLDLYDSERRQWSEDDVAVAKLVADLATGWLMNADRLDKTRQTAVQLQTALNSRIVIEQAKGVLAGERCITVEAAFEVLRGHARSHNVSLRSVADAVVNLGLRP